MLRRRAESESDEVGKNVQENILLKMFIVDSIHSICHIVRAPLILTFSSTFLLSAPHIESALINKDIN